MLYVCKNGEMLQLHLATYQDACGDPKPFLQFFVEIVHALSSGSGAPNLPRVEH